MASMAKIHIANGSGGVAGGWDNALLLLLAITGQCLSVRLLLIHGDFVRDGNIYAEAFDRFWVTPWDTRES